MIEIKKFISPEPGRNLLAVHRFKNEIYFL